MKGLMSLAAAQVPGDSVEPVQAGGDLVRFAVALEARQRQGQDFEDMAVLDADVSAAAVGQGCARPEACRSPRRRRR